MRKWIAETIKFSAVIFLIIFIILLFSFYVLGVHGSDFYSFAQAIIDLVLVPLLVFGYLWTVNEVKKAVATSELDLVFRQGDQLSHEIVIRNPEFASNYPGPHLRLINTGASPSIHHKIVLELEQGVAVLNRDYYDIRNKGNKLEMSLDSEYINIVFPEDEIEIPRLDFRSDSIRNRDQVVINYRVFSDRQELRKGKLIIKFTE